jgi:hypothetical protein
VALTHRLATWLSNYDQPESMGSKLRRKRIAPLMAMIEKVFAEKGHVNIIDLGGTENYWNIISANYLKRYNVSITIVNLHCSARLSPKGVFTFIEGDACKLTQFSDNTFDIVHSNSVVEHVGDWQRMRQFAREVSRLAPNYFVQTPNYWFPIEPHCMTPFFHWLPEPLRVWLVSHFRLGHWQKAVSTSDAVNTVQSAHLLSKRMIQALFGDAVLHTEKLLFLPKSFIAMRMN